MNRAQFAAIIVRELGIKPAVYRGQLEDVQVTDWHASYLAAANEYGVLTGYTDGTARPLNPITREEAMAMVARAMKIVGMLTAISPAATKASHAQFADAEGYADWSQNAAVVIQKA